MHEFLAVDAGGTSTRAVLVDEEGSVLGYGRASGGNPTSIGVDGASAAVAAAIGEALAAAGPRRSVERILLAHAGGGIGFHDRVLERLAPLGLAAPITPAGDLLALFCSGTPELAGAALIAGTGAIGGAIADGRMARVVDAHPLDHEGREGGGGAAVEVVDHG
ncbi:MAG: BadF/BadG/BcrA/BcrD ATPase family protein, partial [Amnibacterium sp.]